MSKVVVVLGGHRSGTSMLAGVLSSLGVYMGDDLVIGQTKENPKGYYEDREFSFLNGDVLVWAGGNWDRPPTEDMRGIPETYHERAKSIFDKRGKHDLWGWKCPRTIHVLDYLYKPLLLKHDTRFLVIDRDLNTVIKSLYLREKQKLDHGECYGIATWYKEALGNFREKAFAPYLDLRYEQVVRNKKSTMRYVSAISEFLEISPTGEQWVEAVNHIDGGLNRSPSARIVKW